ncbi:hypothetical protein Tco_1523045 [Tanacetum coccineum]
MWLKVAVISSATHFSDSEKRHIFAVCLHCRNDGDDDALLFVARSLPTPVSWLGSDTKNVNAAGTGSGHNEVGNVCLVFLLNFIRRLQSGQQVFAATRMDKFDVEDMDIYCNMPQRM